MSDIADFETAGTSPVEDNPPGISGDNDFEGAFPPGDEPIGVEEWGTTAREEQADEPLAQRVLREEPDYEPGDDGVVGRLVQPDGGMVDFDREGTEIATMTDDDGALSAEEAAMHITDSP
jgi:hypothetical protein